MQWYIRENVNVELGSFAFIYHSLLLFSFYGGVNEKLAFCEYKRDVINLYIKVDRLPKYVYSTIVLCKGAVT